MLGWRVIATECGAACLAGAQVHPLSTVFYAFFANMLLWWQYLCYLAYVATEFIVFHDRRLYKSNALKLLKYQKTQSG